MPTNTPIYGFTLPSINDPVDEDVWGGYLNSNFTKTENLLKTSINSVVNNISSAYTIQASDINKSILADATTSAFNINLLPASTAGDGYRITFIKIDNSLNAVTILPKGVEKISGQSSYVLSASGSTVTIVSDGVSNWYTITGVGDASVGDASESSKGIVQLASNAEVSAGTNTTKAVTPAAIKTAIGFSRYYLSSAKTLSNNLSMSYTHGLGAIPKLVQIELVCQSAEGGYSVGDTMLVMNPPSANLSGFGVWYNSTTLGFNYVLNSSTSYFTQKSGGILFITPSKWQVVIRAWA